METLLTISDFLAGTSYLQPGLLFQVNLKNSLPNLVSFLGNFMISVPNHLKPGFFSRRAIGEAVEAALSIETSSAFSGN